MPKRPPLSETHPELAAEAMFDATTVTFGSHSKLAWKCAAHGHVWESSANTRTSNESGCPICSGRRVLAGFNDLQTTHPELVKEADFDPTTVIAGSDKKMPWKCVAHGHTWEADVKSRTGRKYGCPFCSNKRALAGFNDLQTTHPDIAREADFDPTTVVAGSNKKMPWKCAAHGHEWETSANNRSGQNQDCPVCSNRKVLTGFNDLQTTHSEIAQEADFDPTTVTFGSQQKMPWKCTAHGHEWEATVSGRTGDKKSGCPVCSNNQVLAGFNDLQTKYPEVAAEAMFDPTTVIAGSNKKMPWKCTAHGHKWEAVVDSRTGGNETGCPFCSNKKVLSGFNDLLTTYPEIAQEADFDPTTVVFGSSRKMPWKCTAHGHTWEAVVVQRTGIDKTGCPVCADTGFNPGDPAWLYLARHPEWHLLQVGITNHPNRRLKKHASNGWEVLDIRGPMDGYLTRDWEASILRWLTFRNIPRAASGTEESPHFDTPTTGEAWQQSDLNATLVREIMDLVEADEQ